jgi:hypothetical protein
MNPLVEALLFVVAIPLIQQGLKLLADKYGVTLVKWQNQLLAFGLTLVAFLVTGGVAGLVVPAWGGDIFAYVGAWVAQLGPVYAAVMALYEIVWDRLFVAVKFATLDKI